MRSDKITQGVNAAPQRALLYALGLTDKEIGKPLIGIVSSKNDIVPGHMNIDKVVEAVKQGVALAGGIPIVFPAIAVCDGIAMGHEGMKYSLVTRELIADSTEAMATAHPFDGLVMVPNCDKNVPGLLMAAARLNIPSVFVSGGPMLAGILHGQKISYSNVSEAVSRYKVGDIDDAGLEECTAKACPTCGSCSGMFTANSMNCLTEVLGMGLPERHCAGSLLRTSAAGEGSRYADHGAGEKGHQAAGYHGEGSFLKRADHRYGAGLQHQQYAPSPRYRA